MQRPLPTLLLALLLGTSCGPGPVPPAPTPDGGPPTQPTQPTQPTAPAAGIHVRASAEVLAAQVTWTDPSPQVAQGYTVIPLPSGPRVTVEGSARSARVEGLVAGRAYRFRVQATVAGAAPPLSAPSAEVVVRGEPAEVVALQVADAASGCVPVSYALRQPQGLRADVVVEYDAEGNGTFRRATQAGSETHGGVSGVRTSMEAAGAAHTFLWNSSADVGALSTDTLRLRVSTRVGGTEGPAHELPSVSLRNGAVDGRAPRCELRLEGPKRYGPALSGVSAFADVDGDGKPDAVTFEEVFLSVHRGLGNGRFAQSRRTIIEGQLGALAISDLNGDGLSDAVALGRLHVSVHLGRTDGSLRSGVTYPAGTPTRVDFADVDGDGDQDVIIASSAYHANQLVVRRNAGDGTLQEAQPVALSTNVSALAVGDFDADGHPDLVVSGNEITQQGHTLTTLWLGRGDGSFQQGPTPPELALANALVAADFDRDGALDVVASVHGDSVMQLRLLPGAGSGRFRPAVALPPPYGDNRTLQVVDLNEDGNLDLLTTKNCELHGNGTGQFVAQPCEEGYGLWTVQAGMDLDGDGAADRLGTDTWLPGVPGGGYVTGRNLSLQFASGTLAAGDLDRDGTMDLLSSPGFYLAGHADGRFTPRVTSELGLLQGRMHLLDLDADGILDAVSLASNQADALQVARGRGDGSFLPPSKYSQAQGPRSLAAADLNADGHLDLVTSGAGPLTVVRLGQGDTTFGPADASAERGSTRFVFASDVNADGHLDLVSALETGVQPLQRKLGRGDGTFEPATAHPADGKEYLMPIAAGDFDADGLVDVAAHRTWSTTWQLSLLRGLPGGGFQELLSPEAPRVVGEVVEGYAADVDGDGHLDLVATEGYGTVSLFRGRGDGTWHEGLHARTPGWHRLPVLFADADRSGLPELYYESGATLYRLPLR